MNNVPDDGLNFFWTPPSTAKPVDLLKQKFANTMSHSLYNASITGSQPLTKGAHLTNTQRDKVPASSTDMASYSTPSTSQGLESLTCRSDTKDDASKLYSSSGASAFGNNRRISCSEQVDDVQFTSDLGINQVSNRSVSSPPRFNAESATNILLSFGLEKEDLVDLAAYPENEITPDTLPLILHQIHIQKQKRAAGNSSEFRTSISTSLKNSLDSEVTVKNQDKIPKSTLKPSRVIEYEHPDMFVIGKDEIGRTRDHGVSGATLLSDDQKPSSQSGKLLHESIRASESVKRLSSKKKYVLHPGRDPTKRQLKQKNTKPIKSKASKPYPLKEPEPGCMSTLKTKDFCPELLSHPGLKSSNSKQRKTQEKRKVVGKERKHQQMNQNYVQQKAKIQGKRETKQLNKAESKMVKLSSQTTSSQQFVVKRTVSKEPLLPTPITTTIHRRPVLPSSQQPVFKGTLSKGLPTPSVVNDYLATTPRVFPHTCCLCNKECAQMQDWLSHQNTSFHIENCRLLRKRYPRWDGNIQSVLSTQHRTAEPLPSTYQTSQHRHQNAMHESCSRSHGPHHYHDLESGRDISKSSSCSSPWRRHSNSSYSRSYSQDCRSGLQDQWHRSRSRSRSTSPHHHRGSGDRRDRRSSRSGSPQSFRDTHRSRSRSWSPWYDRSASHYQSHSRSNERPSSFNRRDEEWSSPSRSFERQFSPKRNDEKRTSPRWSHERRLSTEKSVPQRRKSSSTERLTKKLLETSALQSLSNQSDFETVVKTLTPVLLAEIDKMKLTSSLLSSSSSYKQGGTELNSKSLKTEGKVDSSAKLKATVPKKPSVTSSVKKKKSVKKLGLVHKEQDKVVCIKKTKILKTTHKKKMNTKQKSVYKRLVVTASTSSDPVCFLTVGEQMEKYLDSKDLWPVASLLSQPSTKNLLITNLPEFYDGCYTEGDIADLLSPFGFKHDNDIYAIPQKRMAVALMPSIGELEAAISASLDGIIFRGSKLSLQALKRSSDMTPFAFYCGLMQQMHSEVADEASVVYVTNISASETRDLREALRKISSVRNFLPLLNKVFIEFDSVRDADRIGVWYSLLKQGRTHKVKRLKLPEGLVTALSPRLAVKALPGVRDIVAGSKVPRANRGVPRGSFPAFWVTMTTCPYAFPTASPWFNIPDFLTVKEVGDIEKADPLGSAFSTIMLTGFRGTRWQYEEISGLLWRYFPQRDLDSLSFNVVVLPLQRRVFVYFTSWDSCCSFVRDHLINPIKAQGFPLSVHFVLEEPHQGCSEEFMYKNLMKWTNAHVSEPESLKERLLCVEVSVININLVIFIMKVVASLASFVNFLPLANRIYIEMSESSGVTRVVNIHLKRGLSKNRLWKKVQNVRPLMSIQKTCSKNSDSSVSDPKLNSTAGGAVAETTKTPVMDQPAENTETHSGGLEQWRKRQEEKEAHKEPSGGMGASFLLPDYFEILDSFDNQIETEGCSKMSEIPSEEFSKSDHGPIQDKLNADEVTDSVNKQEELEPDEVKGVAGDGDATQADESTMRRRTSNTKEEKSPNKQDKIKPREQGSNTGENKKDAEEEDEYNVPAEEDTTCCSTAVEVTDQESFQQLAEESGPGEGESKTQFNQDDTPAENSNSDTATKEEEKENNDSSESKEIVSTLNKTEGEELDEQEPDCKCDNIIEEMVGLMTDEIKQIKEEEIRAPTSRTRGRSRRGTKMIPGKPRTGLVDATAKRQSSPVAADSRLQPFNPNSSYGKEFVVPKMGYFCLLCSVFYAREDTEEDQHCSSKTHYDNVQKHYQKTAEQGKPSKRKTRNPQGSESLKS